MKTFQLMMLPLLLSAAIAQATPPQAPSTPSMNNWLGLQRLEQTFTLINESLYPYKANYLNQVIGLLRSIPAASTAEGNEGRAFVLVALDPFVSDLSSAYIERMLMPHYRSMRTFLSDQRQRGTLSDFPKSQARVREALVMIKAALESSRDFVNVTDELVQLRALIGAVGRAIAAEGDAAQVSALVALSHDTASRALIENLSTLARTHGLGLTVASLMEYLETP